MDLKIAISGKGGAGKSTIATLLAKGLAREEKVLLIDTDPVPTTAKLLEIDQEITPLAKMTAFIEERTGADASRQLFNLNPKVDDVIDKIGIDAGDNLKLLVLGTIETVKSGCFCPENAFLKAFLRYLTKQQGILILDMEAGIEHLTRGTTQSMDLLIVVTEPSQRAVEVVRAIKRQAENVGIGTEKMLAIINKIRTEEEAKKTRGLLDDLDIRTVTEMHYDEKIAESEREGAQLTCDPLTGKELEKLVAVIRHTHETKNVEKG
jgi:CO dehydrogenase maturation factor